MIPASRSGVPSTTHHRPKRAKSMVASRPMSSSSAMARRVHEPVAREAGRHVHIGPPAPGRMMAASIFSAGWLCYLAHQTERHLPFRKQSLRIEADDP